MSRTAQQLLEAESLDRCDYVGEGFSGRVWRKGRYAVKQAHANAEARARVAQEIDLHVELASWPDIPTPRMYAHSEDKSLFVREFIPGPSLYEEIQRGRLSEAQLDGLYRLFEATERFAQETGQRLDFAPVHLFLRGPEYVLGDLGLRIAPSPFAGVRREDFWEALESYIPWRASLDGQVRLRPMRFPPSGRFHIEVPVGPIQAGRLLWVNSWLAQRLGLSWSRGELRKMGGIATHAQTKTATLPASLYQDAAGKGEGFAKGDGRALYLGEIDAKGGARELMLKGCGATPLAWTGNEFHEDGFVSFQRTLWEVSSAHELARLGFDSPEMLAVFGTGKTTIDNTLLEWPAAAAIRVSPTHYRVGHLIHWSDDPEAMEALCLHVGRKLVSPDFDPQKYTHIRRLVQQFSENLGFDVGRTDALNIHGFNPTMGNIRLDGHLLDFSTVRFFRHYVPHFKYMNDTRMLREHKAAMRRHPKNLVSHLRRGGLLKADQARRLISQSRQWFEERYIDGYLDGFCMFLGLPVERMMAHSKHRRKMLVQDTLHLRKLRAKEMLSFFFWKQECPAPLFDVEGRMPEFVRAWRRGEQKPWMQLRSKFEGQLKPFDACIVGSWFDNVRRLLTPSELRRLEPRRWEDIISPFMEVERLAELCYHRSTPEDFEQWQGYISMARQLPRGVYTQHEAQALAEARGHLCFPSVLEPERRYYVVGMTGVLYHQICDRVEAVLGGRLKAILVYGARVRTLAHLSGETRELPRSRRLHLREDGPTSSRTSRMHLAILIEGPPEPLWSEALRQQLNRLGAPFVLARHPHNELLFQSPEDGWEAALEGLSIPLERCVLAFDPKKGCAPEHARWRQ